MTDQTRQRIDNLLIVMHPDEEGRRRYADIAPLKRILAWSDHQSAASAAAALRMAAALADDAENFGAIGKGIAHAILALITPSGTSALASMLEEAERHGYERGQKAVPIDMVLHCPSCGLQHVDEPDERTAGWSNPPHRSHLCHRCGSIWRPADVPTNGVRATQTTGKNDGLKLSTHDARVRDEALEDVAEYLRGCGHNESDIVQMIRALKPKEPGNG